MIKFAEVSPTEYHEGILNKIKEEEKKVECIFTKSLVPFKKGVGNTIIKGNAAVNQALSLITRVINAPADMIESTGRSINKIDSKYLDNIEISLLLWCFVNFTFGVAKKFFDTIEN